MRKLKQSTYEHNHLEGESFEDFTTRWLSMSKEERRAKVNANIASGTKGSHSGHTPWNKGKTNPYTKEQLEKITKGTKEAMQRPEVKAKMKGRVVSDETRNKLKEITTSLWQDEEYKAHQRESYNGWHGAQSKPEKEIADWLSQYIDIETSDRKQIYPLELDIFVPSKNVAIEYNGLYWHSAIVHGKDASTLHLNKTIKCEEKGIRLIHIFEDEWKNKQDIVKSIILSSIGVYERKIPARKCEVKKVDNKTALSFIQANHIMATKKADMLYLGLYYKDELVQLASFRKNFAQRTSDKDIELGRMITLKNTQVLGGFSKIMKHCPYEKITSFIDRRLFDGKGYNNSGWTITGYSKPAYFYTDTVNRFNRQTFMKHNCLKMWDDVTEDMREVDMCMKHKLYQIFDCGTIKVEYLNKISK